MTKLFDNVLDNFKNRMNTLKTEIDPDCIFFKTINEVSISTVYELFEVDKRTIEGMEFLDAVYSNLQDDLYFHIGEANTVTVNEDPGSKNIVKLCEFMYLLEAKMKAINTKIILMKNKTDKTERLKNIDQHLKILNKEIRALALELS